MFGRRTEHILVIETGGLAAFVAAEPVFEAIRGAHPKAKISLLTKGGLQRLARAAPYFDQVAAVPDFRDPETRKAFIRQLKNAKFARVYDLSADEDARRLHAAMGPFRPKWLSAAPPARPRRGEAASAPALPDFAPVYAGAGFLPAARLPDCAWAHAARKDAANMQPSWFGVAGPFGLLLPGEDETRRWPAGNYARLARIMSRAQIMPVLAGGKELHAFGDAVAHEAPEVVDLSGKTDHLQLAALAHEACFFVTDHAEAAHLAMSVGCAGVFICKPGQPAPACKGRDVVLINARDSLADAEPEFVWRTLKSMGLAPDDKTARAAAVL
ncbi:MAG: glycosyltransferase family 9 protein [Amphiplicatus sp.]